LTAEAPSHEVIPVRAERRTRRYDKERGCYVYDISFKTRVPLTDRTAEVARAFGLGVDGGREHVLYRDFELRLAEGDVAYVTGDSGSGKSALLRALRGIWATRRRTSANWRSTGTGPLSTPWGVASPRP